MAHDRTLLITKYERTQAHLKTITVTGPSSTIATHLAQFAATGETDFGGVVPVTPVWNSSNPVVGSINPVTGLFTASGTAGTTNITATQTPVTSAPFPLAVAAQVKTAVIVTPSPVSISDSGSVQLTAVVNDQDPVSPNPISGAAVTWSSGTPSKATVNSSGLVTGAGAGAGSTVITASSSPATPGTSAVTVTASPSVVTTVTVSPNPASVQVGNTQPLSAQSRDQYGNPIADTFTWGTSDASKATVSGSGVVTGVAVGNPTITATSVTVPAKAGSTAVTVSGTPAIPTPSATDYVMYDSTPLWAQAAAIADDTAAQNLAVSMFSAPPAPTFVKDFNGFGTPAMRVDLPTWVYSSVNQPGGIVASASPQTVQLTSTANCNSTTQLPTFEPGIPVAVSPNRESFKGGTSVAGGGCTVNTTNKTVTAIFAKNHADGAPVAIDFDTTSLHGSGFTVFTVAPETLVTYQLTMHLGATAGDNSTLRPLGTVPATQGDRTAAEYFNTLAQPTTPTSNDAPTGFKVLLGLRPDVLLPTTLTQDVVGSGTSQIVSVGSTTGLTVGSRGVQFATDSQIIKNLAGETNPTVVQIDQVIDATHIKAVFKANHANGTLLDMRRNDGRWYCVWRGPQTGVLNFQCDNTPYASGFNFPVNLGPLGLNPDDFIGSDLTITAQFGSGSGMATADGIGRVWMNDQLIFNRTDLKTGPSPWYEMQGPATFRSSAMDQSYYVRNYKGWAANSICTAPTATNRNARPMSIYNNVAIPDQPSGVPSVIRPYVFNGTSFVANNGGGSSDPSFGDITLTTYQRGQVVLVTHNGLTNATNYQIKYSLVNALGESPQSTAVSVTTGLPAFNVGFNFRSTYAYRTSVGTIPPDDAANTIFVSEIRLGSDTTSSATYPQTRTTASGVPITLGWKGTTGNCSANRSTSVDARLAGNVFNTNAAIPRTLRINLPVPGTYTLSAAFGDPANTMNNLRCEFIDGVSGASLTTVTGSTVAGTWIDASGVSRVGASTWVSSNATVPLAVTGDTPYLLIKLGALTAVTSPSRIAFAELTLTG